MNKSALTLPKLRFKGFDGEWESKLLHEISKSSKGKNLSKESIVENGKNKCILYGELFTTYKSTIKENEIISKTNAEGYISKPNSLLFPSSSTSKDDFFPCSSIKINNIHLGMDISIFEIDSKNNSDFLAYMFSNETNLRKLYRLTEGTTINHLYASDIANYKISLPSLPEQQKIAHFFSLLDKQIQLWERKLELYELIYEKKLNNLLNDADEEKEINQICLVKKGEQINKSKLDISGPYKYINGSKEPLGYLNQFNSNKNTISICEGGDCGYAEWHTENFWSGGHSYTLHDFIEGIDNKYFYYLLKSNYLNLKNLATGSTLKNIALSEINKFKIKYIKDKNKQIILKNQLDKIQEILKEITIKISTLNLRKKFYLNNIFI